jgi:hypothetical protein
VADEQGGVERPESNEQPDSGKTFSYRKTLSFGTPLPADEGATVVPGEIKRFRWQLGGQNAEADGQPEVEPATYYEALTGKPDPNRSFFVSARRILSLVLTGIALGIPLLLIGLGLATGADIQTIVFMGVAGLIVGLMIKSSFPRTPFG